MLLSSISNFHKFGYPMISEFTSKSVIMPSHITYAEHVLYDPFSKEDMEGNNIRKYIPVSPCNRIMYFSATLKEVECTTYCATYFWRTRGLMNHLWIMNHLKYQGQERKENIQQNLSQSHREPFYLKLVLTSTKKLNCTNPSRTQKTIFVEQLLTEGSLKWR